MQILRQINKSRAGNDCWIDETYTMCVWLGVYYIIHHWKVSGWGDEKGRIEIVAEPTCDKEIINKQWKCLIKERL